MAASASADPLVRVRIAAAGGAVAWADGLEVTWPRSVLTEAGLERAVTTRGDLRIPADVAPVSQQAAADLRLRAAFTPRPASSRLPVSYRAVPAPVRMSIAHAIGRVQRRRTDRWAAFPRWPIDVSADVLQDLAVPNHPASSAGPTPVLLTHDIDSPEGLRNLVADFLPVEEACGARSTSFIVPCAWPIEEELLRETRARGHDLGIHGYDHANRTPFVSAAERQARLDGGRPLAERFQMIGYRAPSLLRTRDLLADLATRYRYDSSVPTSGGLFPMPNNGCATTRPFQVGGLVEIPVSLPRDGSLRFLGYGAAEILDVWKACAEIVARARGVVVLLTHCERQFSGNRSMLRTYRSFLEWLHDDRRFAWAAPADVLTRV